MPVGLNKMKKEGDSVDKVAKLSISSMDLDLWYEGPSLVVADKPRGQAVHPDTFSGTDTLVNGLLQSNRWLAEMETSLAPGVIHQLMPEDRGLVVVAKDDAMAETLRGLAKEQAMTFSYRVRMPKAVVPLMTDLVSIYDHQEYDDMAVFDIDSPIGDTERLRTEWLGGVSDEAYFVCYQIDIPLPNNPLHIGLGARLWLPAIDLYTVPPCSVCNGTKALLTGYGFGYRDHTLDNEETIAKMRHLRGNQRGIPVIVINGVVSVGYDLHRLKESLNLY